MDFGFYNRALFKIWMNVKRGIIVKAREVFGLNLEMTKHLMKASPKYIMVNSIDALVGAVSAVLQILFYQELIDMVIYFEPSIAKIAVSFLLYYLLCTAVKAFNHWVTLVFNEKEKLHIYLYYKKMIYTESVKKKIEKYSSQTYRNMLHNAIYHNGDYLYYFSSQLFSLMYSVILFVSVLYLFQRLHFIFVFAAVIIAVKNCVCSSRTNKLQYELHQVNMMFERCNTYIYNLFYLKKYIRELRLYPVGNYFISQYRKLKELWWQENKKMTIRRGVVDLICKAIDLLSYALNVIVLMLLLVRGKITVGEFSMVLSNFALLASYIEKIIMFFPAVWDGAKYMKDISEVIHGENYSLKEVKNTMASDDSEEACIKCENLCFSYDGKNNVLNNVTAVLPLTKKIAVVGKNGSGKTTFVKLLMGLYMPTGGAIEYYYPNEHIKNNMELFSVMLQDYRIFALSVADNILPFPDENGKERISNAIRFCGLEEKVETLPQGSDTILTGEFLEDGVCLSGGEQQKTAIARAHARNCPVLILDEPSGRLDPFSERRLIEKINQLSADKSVILVTHNLAYTKNVDLILYFEDGAIVECGSPEQLIKRRGRYEKMFAEQMKRMEVEA